MSREGEDERERRDMRTSRRVPLSVLIQPVPYRPGPRLVSGNSDSDNDNDDGVPP